MKLALALVCFTNLYGSAVNTSGPFEFHSNFWLNLHHFLFEQAQHDTNLGTLSANERTAWDEALALYRQSLIREDLVFDPHLRGIDTELAEDETLPELPLSGADSGLWNTLNAVAPIYRAHWWAAHDRANRAWIVAAVPLVKQYGPQLMKEVTAAYEAQWPRDPVRVDLAEYANWAGAYTYTHGGSQIQEIVSSVDTGNQGFASLEILFHEATHGIVPSVGGQLAEQIARSAQSNGVAAPRDLVHIFIFYTAGELTRRDLAAAGIEDYMPYADKKRLYRMDWARWHNKIQIYWRQHLDGELSLEEAVNRVFAESKR